MIKCEKCGNENQDTAKFCNNCGAKLEIHEDIYVCSKCGTELHGKQRFCTHCGAKMVYTEGENEAFGMPKNQEQVKTAPITVAPTAHTKVVKQEKPAIDGSLLMKITNIVSTSVILLIVLLSFISIFLPFAKMSISFGEIATSETQGFKYWFTDCWKDFKHHSTSYQFATILNFASFLTAIVFVLIVGTMAILNGIASLISGETKKGLMRTASLTVIGPLQYFIFSATNFCNSESVMGIKEGVKPGAGYNLIFVALFLLIAVVIAKAIVGFIHKDISLKTMIFNCVMPFVVAIVLAIAFVKPFCISEGTDSVFTGIFPLLERTTTISYENGMITSTSTSSNLNFAFIMLVCCIVFGMCLIGNALNSNNKVRNIVFSSLLIFFFIIYIFVGKDGIANYMTGGAEESYLGVFKEFVKASTGLKVGMVFTGFILAGGIVQAALPDKK